MIIETTVTEHWKNLSLQNIAEEIGGEFIVEEWRNISAYEGEYLVSNFGRIKSLPRKFSPNEFIMSLAKDYKGYMYCHLKEKTLKVHRLLAIEFLSNHKNKPQVNHKNGIKWDNRLVNLEWATNGENIKHSYDNLGRESGMTGRFGKLHPNSKKVSQYDLSGNFIKTWDSLQDINRETGFNRSNIGSCCLGRTCKDGKGLYYTKRTAHGYIWKYA